MTKRSWIGIGIAVVLLAVLAFSAYRGLTKNKYTKYTDSFFDTFDTIITVVAYTQSGAEFDEHFQRIRDRFTEFHRLYDIYHSYEGLNNVKTVNDNAGVSPVKVDKDLIDLVLFSKEWYTKTDGKTNIAMGPVLRIWHNYREEALLDPAKARIPPIDLLSKAAQLTNLDKVIIDRDESTIYLADRGMSLDLGAVAKGYATEIVAREAQAGGLDSAIISSGGNVRAMGKPQDGVRERWGIGLQDPQKSILSEGDNMLDVVYLNNASVVSSGDYQRYYMVGDKMIHHLIDPVTLMPGDYYHAVTVVTADSGLADFLSTTLFLTPYEEGRRLVEDLDGVEALWAMMDGTVAMTDGMQAIAASGGASGGKPAE